MAQAQLLGNITIDMPQPQGALLHSTVKDGVAIIKGVDDILATLLREETDNEVLLDFAHQVSPSSIYATSSHGFVLIFATHGEWTCNYVDGALLTCVHVYDTSSMTFLLLLAFNFPWMTKACLQQGSKR